MLAQSVSLFPTQIGHLATCAAGQPLKYQINSTEIQHLYDYNHCSFCYVIPSKNMLERLMQLMHAPKIVDAVEAIPIGAIVIRGDVP